MERGMGRGTSVPAPGTVPARPRGILLAFFLIAVAAAGTASASPRLAIAPVKGDPRGDVGAQLIAALCRTYRCVPGTVAGSRSGLARAWIRGVEAVLFSSIQGRRGSRKLAVALFVARGGHPSQTWSLRLGRRGLLRRAELRALVRGIEAALGSAPARRSGAPPPRAAPPAPRPPEAPLPEAPLPEQELPAGRDERVADAAPVTPPGSPAATAPPPPATVRAFVTYEPEQDSTLHPPRDLEEESAESGRALPRLTAQLGVERARSVLRFPTEGTAPLGYALALKAVPLLRLDLRLLRRQAGQAGGPGVFAEAGYQPGIALPAGAATYRATFLRLRGGLLWWLLAGESLALAPAIAWEVERVTIGAPGGTRLADLPEVRLAGPSLGLEVEWQPGLPRLTLLASGRAAWWIEARDLAGGASFLPGGTALGLRAEAGAALRLVGSLSLRVLGGLATSLWWLDADPTGRYTIRFARSDGWGGHASIRVEL